MSSARPSNPFDLCQFQYASGRLCGLPAHPKGDGLCLSHYRQAHTKPARRDDDLSAELANPAGDYITQIDINHVLGKLFDALAAKRCSPRRASSLAYIACLLAQTQKAAKEEARHWSDDKPVFQTMLKIKYPDYPESGEKTAETEVVSLTEERGAGGHDPSAPAQRTGRTNRAARPDAPQPCAEEKIGPLRSG